MSDQRDELNTPAGEEPSYSVDEILSEFSSARARQRVVPFPLRGEDEEDEPYPTAGRTARRSERGGEVVHLPTGSLPFLVKSKVKALFRRADEYADQMYQQAEPTPGELEAEALIPGVDEEELPEEEPEERPRRWRRRPPAPPRDIDPADLAVRFRAGLRGGKTRIFFALICSLAALWLAVELPLPALPGVPDHTLRLTGSAAALGLTLLLCVDVAAAGLAGLFTLRPGAETLAALAALATLADALTMPGLGLRDGTLPLAAPACFVLLFALVGRQLKRRADHQSCRIASQAREPWLLTVDDGKWSGRPAYTKWSGPLHGFGSQLQSPDGLQVVYRLAAPLLLLACVVCSLLASVGREKDGQLLWALSATLTAAAGLTAPLAYALPYRRLARRLARSDTALAGWPGVARCTPNRFVLTDEDLFPTGAVKLNGIKIFGQFSNEKVIAYTGTLVRASRCGLLKPFSDLMKAQNALYRPFAALTFYENGVTAVIHGQEVMVGSAAFLRLMNVALPQGLHVKTALFCAIEGELAGIFAIHYDLHADVSHSISALIRGRLSPLLATRDPNLIPSLLRQRFKLPVDRVEFPAVDRRLQLSDPEQDHSEILSAVLLREGLYPYSDAAIGACRLRTAVRLGSALAVLGAVLGLVLTFYLTFVDAYHSLSPAALLLFLAAWLIPQLALGDQVTRY